MLFIPLLIITGIIWCIFRVIIKKPVVYMITNVIGGVIAMCIVWLPGIKDWETLMSFPCAFVATIIFVTDFVIYLIYRVVKRIVLKHRPPQTEQAATDEETDEATE